jgi:hypothetical protein
MLPDLKKPFQEYAPDEDVPLAGYAAFMTTFALGLGAVLVGVARKRRWQPSLVDVGLLGIATHKLTRIITKDFVTSPLRAPFTRRKQLEGAAEVHDEPRGKGLRGSIGYVLTCPYCSGPWIATGLGTFLLLYPVQTRFVLRMFTAVTISDFLHLSYSRLNESRKTVVAERRHAEIAAAPELPRMPPQSQPRLG